MSVEAFFAAVKAVYLTGSATEHSYRAAIQGLIEGLAPNVMAINEPKRVRCGAPDFVVNNKTITVGHIEAKNLGLDLRNLDASNREQKQRYLAALPNLVYTNCLDWEFYLHGEHVASVSIGSATPNLVENRPAFAQLYDLLENFIAQRPQTISSPVVLAKMMASKAVLIKHILYNTLRDSTEHESELFGQYQAFREHLIHDITVEGFADIYSETVAYGMFAARLHDTVSDGFNRKRALELLPRSNPFLRSLFTYVAGPNLDDRIRWIIDDLAEVFQACDMQELMRGFGDLEQRADPFLHFYEVFLQEYDPARRKARGVWYTPEPVVSFIVRSVDRLLTKEFGLVDGLADTSKVSIDWETGQADKKGKRLTEKRQVHRVQVLDPATGTGTFLAEIVRLIAPRIKEVGDSVWSGYVEQDLIPRLHGFELLMASYAMCHTKLDVVLTDLGYRPTKNPPRLSVFLTNALEESEPADQSLPFAQWLAKEVKQAGAVKRDFPIMCVLGNPPYSAATNNRNPWIENLVSAYKTGLSEKKINLDDDYVKFIRYAEHRIVKSGSGIVAMITNNSFLDGVTHRQMRKHLLESFDDIYIYDLHGSVKKKETSPDGSKDKNVFDIQQGVCISIMVRKARQPTSKRGRSKAGSEPGRVHHADLYGKRKDKYEVLWNSTLESVKFQTLEVHAPHFFFVPKDFAGQERYDQFVRVTDLFVKRGSGVKTERDAVCIHFTREKAQEAVADFLAGDTSKLRRKYNLKKDSRDWTLDGAIADIRCHRGKDLYTKITYRPFDFRHTYYTGTTRGFMGTPGREIGKQFQKPNLGLVVSRTVYGSEPWRDVQVTDSIVEFGIMATRVGNTAPVLPLYLYEDDAEESGSQQPIGLPDEAQRTINFDPKLFRDFRTRAKGTKRGEPDEVAVFDYVYGVLHCPKFREMYREFLKIDFPRVPLPKDGTEFWAVADLGGQLRRLHLMAPDAIGETPYPLMGDGDRSVRKCRYDDGKLWINETQYFDNVPEEAWTLFIGGYQPVQKWLKYRKKALLTFDEVRHLQKIFKVLHETKRLMDLVPLSLD